MGQLKNTFTAKARPEKPVLPLGSDIFSLESNTRSVEEVLIDLGFDPFVFDQGNGYAVRVIQNNVWGKLANAYHYGAFEHGQIFAAYDGSPRTMAPFDWRRAVLTPDLASLGAPEILEFLSNLPGRFLERTQSNADLLKAIIIGHEMEHLEHPRTIRHKPVYTLGIETLCDIRPMMLLDERDARSQDEVFQLTLREFKYARAIAPIIDSIAADRFEFMDSCSLYGHATALMLDEKTQPIFLEEDYAQVAWEANVEAARRIKAVIDHSLGLPYYMAGYIAAKKALAQPDVAEDYTTGVLALFVEAAEYFSPESIKRALEISGQSVCVDNPEESASVSDVSLEIEPGMH